MFVRAVDSAIAVRPEERPRSAGAMEALLEAALGRRTMISATPAAKPRRSRSDRSRSIAVLPFVNLSPDKSLDFFCDGIAEEITNALTAQPGVRVVACSSGLHLSGDSSDLQRVAAMYDVGALLEGSVRASGNSLRVISRLIDAEDGSQRWSERFDCNLDDVFGVQDHIANAAVRALGVAVEEAHSVTAVPVAPSTRNINVYTCYLKGRHYWNKRTESGLHKSVTLLQEAVTKDPDYAERTR